MDIVADLNCKKNDPSFPVFLIKVDCLSLIVAPTAIMLAYMESKSMRCGFQ